jgi:hypothetical protein
LPDNLGLAFEISADPSAAQAALEQFQGTTKMTFQSVAGATQPFNDSLLSSRESVRLLSEEMGVHMPRAVSSAISEMLPQIAGMGTALLGVFAVEQVWRWGKEAVEEMHALEGETKALKQYWQEVNAEQLKLLSHPKTLTDARKDLDDTNKRLLDANAHIVDLKKQLDDLPVGAALKAVWVASALSDWEAKEKDLQKLLMAQLDATTGLEKAEAKRAEEGTVHAAAALKQQQKGLEEQAKMELQRARWLDESLVQMKKNEAAGYAAVQEMTRGQLIQNKAYMEAFAIYESLWGIENRYQADLYKLTPAANAATTATNHLSEARKELIGITQELHQVEQAFQEAEKGELDALMSLTDAAQEIGGEVAGLIGNRKLEAEVNAVFDGAKSVEYMAKFIASDFTDGTALMASVKYGLASAEYAKIAGTRASSGSSSGGGSSYGAGGGISGSGAGPGGGGGGGSAGPGGRGPTIIWNQYGPTVGSMNEFGKAIANTLNQLGRTGQIYLTAQNASTNGPKQS